jgi:hypothetical protein
MTGDFGVQSMPGNASAIARKLSLPGNQNPQALFHICRPAGTTAI